MDVNTDQDFTDLPIHESMKAPYKNCWDNGLEYREPINYKQISRWLHSQVGQPWDDVYSHFCRKFPHRKARELIPAWIELHATKEEKKFFDSRGYPLRPGELVVADGILQKVK